MEITDVKVIPVDDEKLKAFVSIVFDQCFVVTDIKIIHGPKGLFVSMPSKKRKDGTFQDIPHPPNKQDPAVLGGEGAVGLQAAGGAVSGGNCGAGVRQRRNARSRADPERDD